MHNIIHETFSIDTNIRDIEKIIVNKVRNSGDGYGTSRVKELAMGRVFDSYSEAVNYIHEIDSGWYGGYAVKYRDTESLPGSSKVKKLREQIKANLDAKNEYAKASAIQNRKAKKIRCPNCESNLTLKFTRGIVAPFADKSFVVEQY